MECATEGVFPNAIRMYAFRPTNEVQLTLTNAVVGAYHNHTLWSYPFYD